MKKRMQKLFSLALVVSMTAALAGCGSSSSSTSASSAAPAADTTAAAETTAAAAETTAAAAETTTEAAADTSADEGKTLNIQCWNTEFQSRITDHYPGYEKVDDTHGKIGDVDVVWTITPSDDNAYQNNLDSILPDNANADPDSRVDIFLVEADYALKYMNADPAVAMSMDELGITSDDLSKQYQYTKDIVTDSNGEQRGISWQACSAGLIYNREAAKEVLGTDDPDEVQGIGSRMARLSLMTTSRSGLMIPRLLQMQVKRTPTSCGAMTGQRASIRTARYSATSGLHGSSTSRSLLMMLPRSQQTAAGASLPDRSPSTGAAPGSALQKALTTRLSSRTSC